MSKEIYWVLFLDLGTKTGWIRKMGHAGLWVEKSSRFRFRFLFFSLIKGWLFLETNAHLPSIFLISWFLSPHKSLFLLDSLYPTGLAMPPVWFTGTLVAATRFVTSDGGSLFFLICVSVLVITITPTCLTWNTSPI